MAKSHRLLCAVPPHTPTPNTPAQAAVTRLFTERDGSPFQESSSFKVLLLQFTAQKRATLPQEGQEDFLGAWKKFVIAAHPCKGAL